MWLSVQSLGQAVQPLGLAVRRVAQPLAQAARVWRLARAAVSQLEPVAA